MRRAVVLGLLAIVASAGPVNASSGEERVFRTDYDLAAPGPFLSVEVPTPAEDIQAGGTTIELAEDETHLEVFVLDVSHRKVPGRLVFYDADGSQILLEDFCFTIEHPVPNEAARVAVHPSPLVHPCPVAGVHGPATRGELLVTAWS